jgi:hypothetical protein
MTLPDTIDCGWQSDAALIRMRSRANAGAVGCFGISAGMANVNRHFETGSSNIVRRKLEE